MRRDSQSSVCHGTVVGPRLASFESAKMAIWVKTVRFSINAEILEELDKIVQNLKP